MIRAINPGEGNDFYEAHDNERPARAVVGDQLQPVDAGLLCKLCHTVLQQQFCFMFVREVCVCVLAIRDILFNGS